METYNAIGLVLVLAVSASLGEAMPSHRHEMSSCQGVEDGFYVNVGSDCRSYTYCHQGIADVFRYLPGTAFSEKQGKCLEDKNVYCEEPYSRGSQNEAARDLSDEQLQSDLMMLKEKLEKEKAVKAEEEEKKRQIKFRELRDLLDTLRANLESDRSEEKGETPPK